jgi:hypothetical protein
VRGGGSGSATINGGTTTQSPRVLRYQDGCRMAAARSIGLLQSVRPLLEVMECMMGNLELGRLHCETSFTQCQWHRGNDTRCHPL